MHTTPLLNANEPLVNWYLIPESFSATFIENAIADFEIPHGGVVLDPFSGAGTTAVTAKLSGRHGIGIEVNPFLCFAARVKTRILYDLSALRRDVNHLLSEVSSPLESLSIQRSLFTATDTGKEMANFKDALPDMPRRDRWISPIPALKAIIIKHYINTRISDPAHRDLCYLALGTILRPISNMKLSPHAFGSRSPKDDAPVFTLFSEKLHKMIADLGVLANKRERLGDATIIEADARLAEDVMPGVPSCDLAVTSPPYLNNLDYTMQTRLELFFLDFVKNMEGLKALRKRMVTCDAKAIYRDIEDHKEVSQFESIQRIVAQLQEKLGHRKWGWDYPFMTLQYFGGLLRVLRSVRSCLKPGARFLLVVGESAHAGIKVPVPTILGELGEASGYQLEGIRVERYRRSSSHRFQLAESTVILRC